MSEEEELKIKRLLTLYLASLITFPDDHPSHFQLCNPETAMEVREIPKEVIGLRRQYLKAIQANIKARQNYQDLLASRKSDIGSSSAGEEVGGGAARLETHLKLLQMRRRHKEMQITRDYLEKLKKINPAKDGVLDFGSSQSRDDEMSKLASIRGGNGYGSQEEGSNALTKKLERAVIRAKYQLEREKSLLAEVKARHAHEDLQGRVTDLRARVNALSATRDELIRFLEEKMASASIENDDVPALSAEHGDEMTSDRDQIHEQISAEYERYVAARKNVLEAAAKTLSASPELGSEVTSSDTTTKTAEDRTRAPLPGVGQSSVSPLPFITGQLLPLLQNQNATALQNSYTAKVLNAERGKELDSLERLAHESHLLPAYPIMARQERFKNVAAALGGLRTLDQAIMGRKKEKDEMVRRAEAWAFAAEEAKRAQEEFVLEKVRYGNERLDGASTSLALLNELLGVDPQDSTVVGDDSSEPDIWLEAAGAATQKAQSHRPRPNTQEKGPWAGLNGKIGVSGRTES